MSNGIEVNNIDRMFEEIYTEPEVAHIAEIERLAYERKKKEVVDAHLKSERENVAEIEQQAAHTLLSALGSMVLRSIDIPEEERLAICNDVVAAISAGEVENVTINY